MLWLGATDLVKDGTWAWETFASSLNYTRFAPGDPNGGTQENCLIMWQENGNWADLSCMTTLNYHVCEKPTTKPLPPVSNREGMS
jgi:hypothetical protein